MRTKRSEIKRKTPLKTKKPLQAKSQLTARSNLKASKPLRARSEKMAARYRDERVPLVKEMLAEDPNCELYQRIRRVVPGFRDCRRHAIGLHELQKRSAGGSITDRTNVLRCCAPCNSWIEDNPDLAWRCGLVLRRGDTLEDVKKRWLRPETHGYRSPHESD